MSNASSLESRVNGRINVDASGPLTKSYEGKRYAGRGIMETNNILASIDQQIMKLQQVRALLVTDPASEQLVSRRGGPKGSVNKKTAPALSNRPRAL